MNKMSKSTFVVLFITLALFLSFLNISAIAANSGLNCTISIDKNTVTAGQQIKVTATASGGTAPYTYEYDWSAYETYLGNTMLAYHTIEKNSKNNSASSVMSLGETGEIWVTVTDKNKKTFAVSLNFKIAGGGLISNVIPQIASQCTGSASGTYGRIKWLHDYLIRTADYDYSYTHYHPHGVLLLGKGVCQSYATAYQLLLNKVGISNKLVFGKGNNGSGWGGHAWNLVKIGDSWYHVDVSWDDGVGGNRYFLKSDQEMAKDHQWDANKYPASPYAYGEVPVVTARPGDANNDGAVDIMDLVAIMDYIVSGTSVASMANADANGDGVVDIMDLTWIINMITG